MNNTDRTVNQWTSRTNRSGSKKKHPSNFAPSTFSRELTLGRLPYSPLFSESVDELFAYDISDSARLTWIRLQPLFANRLSPGYLVDARTEEPMSVGILAARWRKQETEITQDMEELAKRRFIVKSGEFWSDPMMALYYKNNVPNGSDLDDSLQHSSDSLSQSRVKESRVKERREASPSTDGDADNASSSAPLSSPFPSDGEHASLSDKKANTGSSSDKTSLEANTPVAAAPKPAPAEPTSEELNEHRDAWVEHVRNISPMDLDDMVQYLIKNGAHPDVVHPALKRALGLVKGVSASATLVKFKEDCYCGIDWLRDQKAAA